MGQNFLSRFAVVSVYIAITFVAYCFGKYFIGGRINPDRDSSVVHHIPHGYGASTSSGATAASPEGTHSSDPSKADQPGTTGLPGKPRISIELKAPSQSAKPSSKTSETGEAASQSSDSTQSPKDNSRDSEDSAGKQRDNESQTSESTVRKSQERTKPPTRRESENAAPKPKAKRPNGKPSAEPVAVSSEKTYRVVVGAFTSRDNSKALASQLTKKGYYTFTTTKDVGGKTYYRVQAGAFAEKEKAVKLKQELESQGFKSTLSGQ